MAMSQTLKPSFRAFIECQHIFFVATAAPDGRVNLSPKGLDALRILSDTQIVWLNLSGSGNETAAHIREAPRMTLMFMAMDGDPLILRVYGTAAVYHPGEAGWDRYATLFDPMAGARQVFDLTIDLVQTSCGSGVPFFDYRGQRGSDALLPFFEKMGPDGIEAYWQRKNKVSIDGKPTGL